MYDLVTYSAPATGGAVAAYALARATSPEGPFSIVATAGPDATSFRSNVAQTGTFYYAVTASGPGREGPVSEAADNASGNHAGNSTAPGR